MNIPPDVWQSCLEVLQQISEDPSMVNEEERFKSLIAKIHRQGKKGERRITRQDRIAEDRELKSATGMAQKQQRLSAPHALPASGASLPVRLQRPNPCYICKTPYTELHFFYHLLCPACAELNYRMRFLRTDLTGRVALITGGRIKIGYETALRLLRDGAHVIVTTRFANDAQKRFQAQEDFAVWQERLQIMTLDLRDLPSVESFARYLLQTETALDILIHNAAQTIRRPPEYYRALLSEENSQQALLPDAASDLEGPHSEQTDLQESRTHNPNTLTSLSKYFPANAFDADGQPLDLRPVNSWKLKLDQVGAVEMVEVQLINAIAPFLLNGRLKPLLLRSRFPRRFIINVSAMEGQFQREFKTVFHPHTNMAKAALNMMTRTSAADYAREGIFMNSVDTGWITDENPYPTRIHLQETRRFYAPLDAVDGMARIYAPIVQGIEDPAEPPYGHFLKDYTPCPW